MPNSSAEAVRLQLLLSRAGIASRRECARIISAGRVTVDGILVTTPGLRVDPGAIVQLDGKTVVTSAPPFRTIMLHKPPGYICSRKRQSNDDQLIYALIPEIDDRLVTVGRLDKESEGLILLTNDGQLTQQLTHPRYEHIKRYEVQLDSRVRGSQLKTLRACREISSDPIRPVTVTLHPDSAGEDVIIFELKEGRNRQIRRMCAQAGLTIQRLIRFSIGNLGLGNLAPGAWRDLSKDEIESLKHPLKDP